MKSLFAALDAGMGLVDRQGVGTLIGVQIGATSESTVYSFGGDHRVGVDLSVIIVKCPPTFLDHFGEKRVWAHRGQVGRSSAHVRIEKCELEFATHKL